MAELKSWPGTELLPRRRIAAGTDARPVANDSPYDPVNALYRALDAFVGGGGRARDYFTNVPARMGFGTASLAESADYELVRLSFNYWLLITQYENHWITAKIVDTPAEDMVKAWPRLTSEIKPQEITAIDRAIRITQTKQNLLTAMKWGRLFGGAGALIVIDGQEDNLDEPIDYDSIGPGDYKGLIPFDRWTGIYPSGQVCTDVNRPVDFNRPEYYTVSAPSGGGSFQVHCSRILRFVGPEMPTPEREAHSWWGISEIVRAYEEIRKRDNMSWNILSLTFRANIIGIKNEQLNRIKSGLGMGPQGAMLWQSQIQAMNELLSNQSMVALGKDDDLKQINYSFSGLSECYQQFQLDISGATGIPVSRLFGRTITGLGQSNDADERIYEERIATDQDNRMRPQLEKLYPVLCMSAIGEIPDDLDLVFPSVRVLDEKEKSDLAKTTVDTVTVLFNSGIISKQIAAKEIKQASDITGFGTNLTDEFIADLPDTVDEPGEMGGLFGEEEGEPTLSPSSSPQRVLREQGREKEQKQKGGGEEKESPEDSEMADSILADLAHAADADRPAVDQRSIHGLDVVVEYPKGAVRRGNDWKIALPYDYGFLRGVPGADGDSLDVALGSGPDNHWVYIFDQRHAPPRKGFDESKVFINWPSMKAALDAFSAGHNRAHDVYMDMTPMPIDAFKTWLLTHDMKTPAGMVSK